MLRFVSCPYRVVSLSMSLLLSLSLFLHPIAFLLGEFTHFCCNKMECFCIWVWFCLLFYYPVCGFLYNVLCGIFTVKWLMVLPFFFFFRFYFVSPTCMWEIHYPWAICKLSCLGSWLLSLHFRYGFQIVTILWDDADYYSYF